MSVTTKYLGKGKLRLRRKRIRFGAPIRPDDLVKLQVLVFEDPETGEKLWEDVIEFNGEQGEVTGYARDYTKFTDVGDFTTRSSNVNKNLRTIVVYRP
jgi:hypothetical protein